MHYARYSYLGSLLGCWWLRIILSPAVEQGTCVKKKSLPALITWSLHNRQREMRGIGDSGSRAQIGRAFRRLGVKPKRQPGSAEKHERQSGRSKPQFDGTHTRPTWRNS